jgi:hypothetical protein
MLEMGFVLINRLFSKVCARAASEECLLDHFLQCNQMLGRKRAVT